MSVFVLMLLAGMGIAVLFASRTDVRASLSDLRSKRSFYLAEAGLEAARERLRVNNLASADPASLDDELRAAAGANVSLDFTPSSLRASYDEQGRVTAFTGFGDDAPIAPLTAFGNGWYTAFVTNDPIDGPTNLNDSNERLRVTSMGAGPDRSVAVVDAVLERFQVPAIPATITILGPNALFDGGSSNAKIYAGDDCYHSASYTGIPGLHVPVVGVIGASSVSSAASGVRKPNSYFSGASTGTATVRDLSGVIDPSWLDCDYLRRLASSVRAAADHVCTASSPCNHWASTTIHTVTFVDGDVSNVSGKGILWVTGELTMRGNDSWEGIVFVVGEGSFQRSGGGNGRTYGGTVVADLAGPDGIFETGDDCSGANGGFRQATYDASGNGTHDTVFCSSAISQAGLGLPLQVVSFRER
jgi:hypothetical protein